MPTPEKPTFARLLAELKPYRTWLALGSGFMLIAAPASLFHPLVWMFVTDTVLIQGEHHLLVPALVVMVVVHTGSLILGSLRDRCFSKAGLLFTRDLRDRLFRKLSRQTAGYLHNHRSGDLNARVISDVDALQSSLLSGFTSLVSECLTFVLVIGAVIAIKQVKDQVRSHGGFVAEEDRHATTGILDGLEHFLTR